MPKLQMKIDDDKVAKWRALRSIGWSYSKICGDERWLVSVATVRRYCEGFPIKEEEKRKGPPTPRITPDGHWHAARSYFVEGRGSVQEMTHRGYWRKYRSDEELPTYIRRTCDDPRCLNPFHYEAENPSQHELRRGTYKKLDEDEVARAFRLWNEEGMNFTDLATRFDCCPETVRKSVMELAHQNYDKLTPRAKRKIDNHRRLMETRQHDRFV